MSNDDDMVTVCRQRKLNSVMEMEHVIESHGDGTISEPGSGIWAPEVIFEDITRDENGKWVWRGGEFTKWELLPIANGKRYTSQYSYDGPVMHESEYIGGGLARDIKENPGFYVAVVVTTLEPLEGCEHCENEGAIEGHPTPCDMHNIAGWTVAFQPTPEMIAVADAACREIAQELLD